MIEQKAKITGLLPNGMAQFAVVRQSACSGDCHQCSGCGAVEQTVSAVAQNTIGAQPGDLVYVVSRGGAVLWAAVLVYLMPLLGFFCGYFAALALSLPAGWFGGVAFLLGMVPAFIYNQRRKCNPIKFEIVGFVE